MSPCRCRRCSPATSPPRTACGQRPSIRASHSPWSDYSYRRLPSATPTAMRVRALRITSCATGPSSPSWMVGAILLGIGTALVYPTLLAAVSDVAPPDWRASAMGVYRLWRDSGYAIGAIAAGLLADAFTMPFAIGAIAALTFASGVVVASVMYQTLPDGSTGWRVGPINAQRSLGGAGAGTGVVAPTGES